MLAIKFIPFLPLLSDRVINYVTKTGILFISFVAMREKN